MFVHRCKNINIYCKRFSPSGWKLQFPLDNVCFPISLNIVLLVGYLYVEIKIKPFAYTLEWCRKRGKIHVTAENKIILNNILYNRNTMQNVSIQNEAVLTSTSCLEFIYVLWEQYFHAWSETLIIQYTCVYIHIFMLVYFETDHVVTTDRDACVCILSLFLVPSPISSNIYDR